MSAPAPQFPPTPVSVHCTESVPARRLTAPSQLTPRSRQPAELLGVVPPALAALLAARDSRAREAAWGEFLEAYSRLLLDTAYHLGRSYDGALDRYAFMLDQLRRDDYRKLRSFSPDGPARFSTWLAVVARRLCLDRARQHYGRRRATAEGVRRERAEAVLAARRHIVDLMAERIDVTSLADEGKPEPSDELAAADRSRVLETVVGQLSPRSQLLLKLRFERDLPAREIAELMGFPSQFHVYRELKALLGALRRSLQRSGIEEASG